ncbi:TPA: Dot/Icm T4SS effector Lem22, partial [Legionella pneumophila]|nr:Dot/Icm T4SS effector Lem22 [Legionella pneumophila]
MPAFKKGQNPVTELTRLKEYMEDQIAKAKESSSLTA